MNTIEFGKNTVREAVRSGEAIAVYVLAKHRNDPIVLEANESKIPVEFVTEEELRRISKSNLSQGFAAKVKPIREYSLNEIIDYAKDKENPLILILDGIEDPHNLGAILRSSDAFGVDGIVLKKRGEVQLNATVAKVSTGAIHYVKTTTVSNLSASITTLKKNGYWVVASDGSGTMSYDEVDYRGPIALVVGSEGFGISNLVLRNSDFIVKIPMLGHVNSLNASVATGILLAGIRQLQK